MHDIFSSKYFTQILCHYSHFWNSIIYVLKSIHIAKNEYIYKLLQYNTTAVPNPSPSIVYTFVFFFYHSVSMHSASQGLKVSKWWSFTGQLRMAQSSACVECVWQHSKLITACVCKQIYIKGCCINCDYITLVLELPRIGSRLIGYVRSLMSFVHFGLAEL